MTDSSLANRRIALALAALAVAFAAGCGAVTTTAPSGDAGGNHLAAFTSNRGGNWALYLFDLDQVGFRALRNIGAACPESEPCLSSDAQLLAYATPAAGGDTNLALYDRGREQVVTVPGLNSTSVERWPRFTDDGLKLAFVRDSAGVRRVRLYESIGDTLVRLPGLDAPGAAHDDQPSPDATGANIAFVSDRGGKRHVYLWDRTLGGVRNLPALVGDDEDVEPSLSPDGRWLAFATNRTGGAGGWDVALFDLTAGAFVPLPALNTSDDERHPSVSRDGSVIAFATNRPSTNGGPSEVVFYFRSDSTVRVPNGLPSPGDDRQPFLRWR